MLRSFSIIGGNPLSRDDLDLFTWLGIIASLTTTKRATVVVAHDTKVLFGVALGGRWVRGVRSEG